MATRASLFVLALSAAALVAAAACTSSTKTCDDDGSCAEQCPAVEGLTCYQVTNSGTCGEEFAAAPCQSCPAGFVEQGACTPAEDGGAKDGATDAPQNDAGDAATD